MTASNGRPPERRSDGTPRRVPGSDQPPSSCTLTPTRCRRGYPTVPSTRRTGREWTKRVSPIPAWRGLPRVCWDHGTCFLWEPSQLMFCVATWVQGASLREWGSVALILVAVLREVQPTLPNGARSSFRTSSRSVFFIFSVGHGVVVRASGHHSLLMSCSFTKQELAGSIGRKPRFASTMSASCRNSSMRKWRQLNDRVIHSRICRTGRSKKNGVFRISPSPGFSESRDRHKKIHTVCTDQISVPGQRRTKNPRWELIKRFLPASLAHHRTSHDHYFVTHLHLDLSRHCGVPGVSCCGSGNPVLSRRCSVPLPSCCGSGKRSKSVFPGVP